MQQFEKEKKKGERNIRKRVNREKRRKHEEQKQ